MARSSILALRNYYQTTASEYDSFLEEELSLQETSSFLSLTPPEYHGPLLDIASGTGRISQALSAGGLYYVGLDVSDSMLRVLREKTLRESIDLICASATQLPFHNSSFPFVTCFGLTGYLNSQVQRNLMTEISRILTYAGHAAVDFLRPWAKPSRLIQREEAQAGNRVYLLSIIGIRDRLQVANFKIIDNRKTPRQIQFLLRKKSGKD